MTIPNTIIPYELLLATHLTEAFIEGDPRVDVTGDEATLKAERATSSAAC